jgi:hypothetical protein
VLALYESGTRDLESGDIISFANVPLVNLAIHIVRGAYDSVAGRGRPPPASGGK